MLDREGSGFWLFIYSLGLLGVLSSLFFLSVNPENEFNRFKGIFEEIPKEFYKVAADSEFQMLNTEQKIRERAFRTTKEFGDNGGFSKDNICEKRDGYVVIDFENCNPDLKMNYIELFNKDLNLEDLDIKENRIIGSSGLIEAEGSLTNVNIRYEIENKFSQDVLLDLEFISQMLARLEDCKNRKQDLVKCTGIEPELKEGYAFFTIENDKNGLMIMENGARIEKPAFKFAVKNRENIIA